MSTRKGDCSQLLTFSTFRFTRPFFFYIVLRFLKETAVKTKKIKPIMVRPSPELRREIELEAQRQKRSMGNLLLIIVMKFFNNQDSDARAVE